MKIEPRIGIQFNQLVDIPSHGFGEGREKRRRINYDFSPPKRDLLGPTTRANLACSVIAS